jgi:hypothetical protein
MIRILALATLVATCSPAVAQTNHRKPRESRDRQLIRQVEDQSAGRKDSGNQSARIRLARLV